MDSIVDYFSKVLEDLKWSEAESLRKLPIFQCGSGESCKLEAFNELILKITKVLLEKKVHSVKGVVHSLLQEEETVHKIWSMKFNPGEDPKVFTKEVILTIHSSNSSIQITPDGVLKPWVFRTLGQVFEEENVEINLDPQFVNKSMRFLRKKPHRVFICNGSPRQVIFEGQVIGFTCQPQKLGCLESLAPGECGVLHMYVDDAPEEGLRLSVNGHVLEENKSYIFSRGNFLEITEQV